MRVDWTEELVDQLAGHWERAARPRLDGLTDDEYFWEPTQDCWSLRRREDARTPMAAGSGDWLLDFAYPEPTPAPVTTIAWRLGHLIVGIFGARTASHFGGGYMDYDSWVYPGTAEGALTQLDYTYQEWIKGVRGLDEAALEEPVGEEEAPWDEYPMATLVLHINREVIHHMAEIALLRDLYLRR